MAVKKTRENIGGGKAGPGRPRGVPNKATADVRQAIADLLGHNVHNFALWLAAVAEGEGEPRLNDDGEPILDDQGKPLMEWIRRPEPGAALKLAMDMAEFHIPKLARTEHTGENGGAIKVEGAVAFISPVPR